MVMLAGQGSNLQPPDPKSGVLPLNYRPFLAVELRLLTLAVKKCPRASSHLWCGEAAGRVNASGENVLR